MIPIFRDLAEDRASEYATVLASERISHRLMPGGEGWTLLVDEEQAPAAIDLLARYLRENAPVLSLDETDAAPRGAITYSGVWVALFLAVIHAAVVLSENQEPLFDRMGASADRILDGEIFRCITALLLHADFNHLIGNLFGVLLFGTAVCWYTGWGIGWTLILVGGAAGNGLNALFYRTQHLSVGASTAVFGAVGVLCAMALLSGVRRRDKFFRATLPLGAGLGLLAFLGAGLHTDLLAHLFGFVAGTLVGAGFGLFRRHIAPPWVQMTAALISAALVAVSWGAGVMMH